MHNGCSAMKLNDLERAMHAGERPPREGEALLQGILLCGGCGRQMSTRYQAGRGYYECSKSRADHVETPRCRSVRWI